MWRSEPFDPGPRRSKVVALRKAGRSFREIGNIIGVSASRAHQIWEQAVGHPQTLIPARHWSAIMSRALNALRSAGIDNPETISSVSDEELLRIRNLGPQSLVALRRMWPKA